MLIFWICKRTIRESYDARQRKSTGIVTKVNCDDAKLMSKWAWKGVQDGGRRNQCNTSWNVVWLSKHREAVQLDRKHYGHPRLGDLRQLRRDRTFKVLSRICTNSSSRSLWLLVASTFQFIWEIWLETHHVWCVILDFDPLVSYGTTFQRHGIAFAFQLNLPTKQWTVINLIKSLSWDECCRISQWIW